MDKKAELRRYWAQREDSEAGALTLPPAGRLFRSAVDGLREESFLQEWFGYSCVDAGEVSGLAGLHPEAFAFGRTWLEGLGPPTEEWLALDELHLLTAVEPLYGHDEPKTGSDGFPRVEFVLVVGSSMYPEKAFAGLQRSIPRTQHSSTYSAGSHTSS